MPDSKIIITFLIALTGMPYFLSAQALPDTTKLPEDSVRQVFQYFANRQILANDTNYVQFYLLTIKPVEEDPWIWYYKSNLTKKRLDSMKAAVAGLSMAEAKTAYENLLKSDGDPHYKETVSRVFKTNELMRRVLLKHPVLIRLPHGAYTRLLGHADSVLDTRFHTKKWGK